MILWLAACLPHGAVGRPVEEAAAYALTVEGATHTLTRQHARDFPDGSSGWLVCVDTAPTACIEARTFPTGELLVLRGLLAWPEALRDTTLGLWPVLSPRLDTEPEAVSGWPVARLGRDSVRLTGRGPWSRRGADWRWAPALAVSGPGGWVVRGTYASGVRVGRDGTESGDWSLTGEVCSAAGNCRPLHSVGALRRTGGVPARAVAPCPSETVPASRAPLCVAGAVIDDPESAPPPFGLR